MLRGSNSAYSVFILRAYGPGEFKVLSSRDGGNYEEAACWRSTSRSEVSYEDTVMFDSVQTVKSLTIVMKAPMPWGYFGLNDVSLITSGGESFMVISGATSVSGERCLTGDGGELSVENCLDAVASGDGRDVFRFQGEQIAHVATNSCISVINGDASRVGLQDCQLAAKAQDGRSAWELTQNAQLKMSRMGNYCLTLEEGRATAIDCSDAAQAGDSADKYNLATVPELDLSGAASVKAGASLLAATVERQRHALSKLQTLLPSLDSCKFATLFVNASHNAKPAALYHEGMVSATVNKFGVEDVAMAAVGKIYSSNGVDIAGAIQLISESASALHTAEAKIAQAA